MGQLRDLDTQTLLIIVGFFIAGFAIVWLFFSLGPKRNPGTQGPKVQETQQKPSTAPDAKREWFVVLEVDQQAPFEEIASAYRRKIVQYHPDKVAHLGPELKAIAEQKSLEINSAFAMAKRLRGHS